MVYGQNVVCIRNSKDYFEYFFSSVAKTWQSSKVFPFSDVEMF